MIGAAASARDAAAEGQDVCEAEVARLIVEILHLEDRPTDIQPEAALFGEGLGLDSIDALELSLAISKKYGVELKSDDARNKKIFASLRNLAGIHRDQPHALIHCGANEGRRVLF